MKRSFPNRLAACFLALAFIVPVFAAAPLYAHAQTPAVPTGEVPFSLVTLKNITTAAATWAQYINEYILQPAALIKSGNLLKSMTAGVIGYVTGQANGTGAPQFVQDLQQNLQRVGDTQAFAFFVQYNRNSNSPFKSSITSALRTQYLQQTSAAGFWAANRSTLAQFSPNVNAFLGGNWSQGGVRAWFALTTQQQNNPFLLYQASQSQLSSVVTGATAARLETLKWGQGFLSWCGPNDDFVGPPAPACTSRSIPGDACTTAAGVPGTCAASELGTDCVPRTGANPGDACYQSDGTAGKIKTPASVITASLNKVLGANQDKLVQIGNVANDIGGILGNLASIWQTIQFAQQVLGGSSGGGLYGLGQGLSSNSNTRPNGSPPTNPSDDPVVEQYVFDLTSRINQYETAWNTLRASANTASSSLGSLIEFCRTQTTASSPVIISSAQNAHATKVAPVFAQAASASSTIAAARARVQAVASSTATVDAQALQNVSPTAAEVAAAQYETDTGRRAEASPTGSLAITGGSIASQMDLISANTIGLRNACITGTVPGGSGESGG